MNELIEKVENLKNALEEEPRVKALKEMQKKIFQNKDLLGKIEQYQNTQDERIKKEIETDPFYREYKHQENECNFIILEMNQKLKQIKDKGKCDIHENH